MSQIFSIKDQVDRAPEVNDGSFTREDGLLAGAINSPTVVSVGTIPINYEVEVIYGFMTQ